MARILVIEDETPIRQMLGRVLTNAGYEVVDAPNGEEGLQTYRRAPADLIITDIQMDHKNGLDVIQELNRDFPQVKIIAVTGYEPEALSRALQLGARRTFTKPFHIRDILLAVQDLLAG